MSDLTMALLKKLVVEAKTAENDSAKAIRDKHMGAREAETQAWLAHRQMMDNLHARIDEVTTTVYVVRARMTEGNICKSVWCVDLDEFKRTVVSLLQQRARLWRHSMILTNYAKATFKKSSTKIKLKNKNQLFFI
jgi:hypothetical protein